MTRRQAPGVQHEHGGGGSQGPSHGQGIGLGLALLAIGSRPGQSAAPVPAGLPLLDSFDRANENPLSGGGNWNKNNFSPALQLVSNAATGNSAIALSFGYWTPATFGPNCGTSIIVTTLPANTANYVRLYVRLNDPSQSLTSGYFFQWSNDANGCRLFRIDAGTTVQLTQAAAARYTTNDVLMLTANGSTLAVVNNGVQVLTATDATYGAAGSIALGARDTTTRLDVFRGGTL